MTLTLLAGSANVPLAEAIAAHLGVPLGERVLERFPDGELHVALLTSVRRRDVYLLQSTGPPADAHLMELCLLADACRRAGADRLTAVIPYFGYARQDRRAQGREAVAARVVADLVQAAGIDRVVALDLHSPALEGFFTVPLEHVSAVPLLAEAVRPLLPEPAVVVAPDLGAARLAEWYARLLGLSMAVVHKTRVSGTEVTAGAVVGEVGGRVPVIVDDMVSTAGTVIAAADALEAAGSQPGVVVVASHGLFTGPAPARLRALAPRALVVTDSVPPPPLALPLQQVSVAPLLAEVVARLHDGRSLADLIAHR